MAETVINIVASYLSNLTATNPICTAFGSTLTEGTNLFIYSEPYENTDMITLIPYGPSPPAPDGYKQKANIQIRMKSSNRSTLMSTQQAIINTLHMNQLGGSGQMMSNTSVPIPLEDLEGGEYKLSVSNFKIIYVKI